MKDTASVVVIGGGVMGCSLIYHLTKLGWNDVVLVEKNELTAGSTWHAAGLCTHYAHNITVMNLRAHSVHLYKSVVEEETGQPVSFHPTGALRVTTKADRMDEFRHVQGLGKFAGFDFNILTPGELKTIYPLVDTTGLLGAIHEPLDGYVDPSQATHAMAKGARSRGAEVYRHTKVTSVHRTHGEWVVQTDKGNIKAEHVVNAAGTWCREVGLMMGVDLPVVPMLHQYIVTDRIAEFAELSAEMPFIRDPDESWYLRQERDGVIIGPYERNGQPWSIDGVPPEFGMELLPPDLDKIESIVSQCMDRVPGVAKGGIKSIVNGPITFTPDANPLIGPAFSLPNAWVLTGSSMGVMEGGGAGRFLAEWMDGNAPPSDAMAIDSRRFGGYADRSYRVDKAVECFAAQFGIHYPYEERPAARNKKLTPIYHRLRELGAVFGSVYGWERPNWFARNGEEPISHLSFQRTNWFDAVAKECEAVRERVAISDLSVFSKFRVSGVRAKAFMDELGANRVPDRDGAMGLTHALTEQGGVASEFSVTRFSGEQYYLVSAAAAERHDEDLLRQRASHYDGVEIANVSGEVAVLGVMGPRAGQLLSELCDVDFSQTAFPWLTCQVIDIQGIQAKAFRVSYVGESGWELHVKRDQQLRLFNQLWETGLRFGVGLYGAFAMNSMRLEKGYRAWGADYTTERTPFESGVPGFVKLKNREFIGKAAMIQRKNQSDHWRMHLLMLESGRDEPFYGHTVFQNGKPIGLVTSASYGHRINASIALAYFNEEPDDSPLFVRILGNEIVAKILNEAPYDPNNLLLRG